MSFPLFGFGLECTFNNNNLYKLGVNVFYYYYFYELNQSRIILHEVNATGSNHPTIFFLLYQYVKKKKKKIYK